MGNSVEKLYIGRQPILNDKKNIRAFELLYRQNPFEKTAKFPSSKEATAHVLSVLSRYIDEISEGKDIFINFDELSIYFPLEEFLNPDKIVIEILENTKIDDKFIKRIKTLKEIGFRLALDDFIFREDMLTFVDLIDFIKVDVLDTSPDQLTKIENFFRSNFPNIILLAEKVEDLDTFKIFLKKGYKLFQGYFFAKPEIIEKSKIAPYYSTLIQLFNELTKEFPSIKKLEDLIKKDVNLSISLLKYINSAYFSLRTPLKDIRSAINLIGTKKIRAWILIMLYSRNFESDIKNSPLLDLALLRGETLEILGEKIKICSGDECYLTGILSLIDVAVGAEKKDILQNLSVSNEIKTAVLEYKGPLGELLKAIEVYERSQYKEVDKLLQNYNLTIKDIIEAETEANLYISSFKNIITKQD